MRFPAVLLLVFSIPTTIPTAIPTAIPIALLTATHAQAKPVYGSVLVDSIYSVYDADTFRANIEEWPAIVGQRVPIRVRGIDAPEIRGRCEEEKALAREARDLAAMLLNSAQEVELRNIERGKYFRLLADVYVDGTSLATLLIDSNLSRPYEGGRRLPWCG